MDRWFAALGIPDRSGDVLGIITAFLLIVLARWLLPADAKKGARQPLLFLVLAIAFGIVSAALDDNSHAGRVFSFLYTLFLLASCGKSLVLIAVDVIFSRRKHQAAPRIFRDLTQALVYVVIVLITLRAQGVEPSSILTTSALLTAVIGLALQDTLGNMVSGLALQMQRPFRVGDWIQFDTDARQIGQVTEVNWRATTLMTNDLVEVIVPNAMLARAAIRNFTQPSNVSRRVVTVQGAYSASPERAHRAMMDAVKGAPGVLADPAPYVQTRNFGDSGIEYAVCFFISDFEWRERTDGHVRDRVWYAMRRAELDIPFPQRTIHTVSAEAHERSHDRELARRDRALRGVDFLDALPDDAHRALADAAELRLFAPGELIVEQGDASGELFIIDRGEVVVELPREDKSPREVARLGAGKFFGEMGLMTGEPRNASVRANAECAVLVISHSAFETTLAKNPELIERISSLLLARQAELEAAENRRDTMIEPMEDRSKRLISQIKMFFKLV